LKKPAAGFPARARKFCDDVDMPVICPTCQIFIGRRFSSPATGLFESLHRWRGFPGRDRFGPIGNRRRTYLGGGLLLRTGV
jgi:hypothetical protein